VPRAPSFVRWIVQALIVGLLALHLPLDALRGRAPVTEATSSCCGSCAPAPDAPAEQPVIDGAHPPAPEDGCDLGCHCGCCGGVPLVAEVRPTTQLEVTSAPSPSFDRATARRARRLEIFHPPRA
jgi:hypothetical protein